MRFVLAVKCFKGTAVTPLRRACAVLWKRNAVHDHQVEVAAAWDIGFLEALSPHARASFAREVQQSLPPVAVGQWRRGYPNRAVLQLPNFEHNARGRLDQWYDDAHPSPTIAIPFADIMFEATIPADVQLPDAAARTDLTGDFGRVYYIAFGGG